MKKVLSTILAVVLIFNISVLNVSATETDASVSMSIVAANPGDKIEVFIGVDCSDGIKTLTFYDFNYDSVALTIVENECAWLVSGKIKDIDFVNNASIITFDDNTEHSGSILKLVFWVSEDAQTGNYPISCKTKMTRMINGVETKLSVPNVNGMVNVSLPMETQTVSGDITSFLSDTDVITLTLTSENNSAVSYSVEVTGNNADYSFENIEKGDYILSVSKENHISREYEITISDESVTQNVKIHLLGDINGDGKVNAIDVARANAHAKGASALSGYEFDCVDVNGDGRVNAIDVALINAHSKGTKSLW